jgi:hypothetical protein
LAELVDQLPARKPTPYETVMFAKAIAGGESSFSDDFDTAMISNHEAKDAVQ